MKIKYQILFLVMIVGLFSGVNLQKAKATTANLDAGFSGNNGFYRCDSTGVKDCYFETSVGAFASPEYTNYQTYKGHFAFGIDQSFNGGTITNLDVCISEGRGMAANPLACTTFYYGGRGCGWGGGGGSCGIKPYFGGGGAPPPTKFFFFLGEAGLQPNLVLALSRRHPNS